MASAWQKHLARFGYTPILLPSSDFDVFTLVYERDGRRGHDNAFDALVSSATGTRPTIDRDHIVAPIEGTMTRKLEVAFGLKILSGLLSALGAGTLGLSLGFKNASEITFAYKDVTKDRVSAVALEGFLRTCPAPDGNLLERWLNDNLYVITSVLRSKRIEVSAKDSSGQDVELDVPVIQEAVGGNIKVERGGTSSTKIVFDGPIALPFAATLYRIKRYKPTNPDTLTLRETRAGTVRVKSASATMPDGFDFEVEMDDTAEAIELIAPEILEEGLGLPDA